MRLTLLRALVLCAAVPSVARADLSRLELSFGAGVHRLSAELDVGGIHQLGALRRGVLDTTLAQLVARASYDLHRHVALGVALSVAPGRLEGQTLAILAYRAELRVLVWAHGPIRPFLLATGGGQSVFSPEALVGSDTDGLFGWGAGVLLPLLPRLGVRLELLHLMTDGLAPSSVAHTIAVALSLTLRPRALAPAPRALSIPDRDGDGLLDSHDRCPDEPEDGNGVDDDDGCP